MPERVIGGGGARAHARVGEAEGLGDDAAAELGRLAHDEVGMPVAAEGEQVGRHHRGIDPGEEAGRRPFGPLVFGRLQPAGEDFPGGTPTAVEARREGAEARLLDGRGE